MKLLKKASTMNPVASITEIELGHGTHAGMSGKHNEDSYGIFAWDLGDGRTIHLGVVADGVGGQSAGEVASSLAIETIKEYFDRQHDVSRLNSHMRRAILAANERIIAHSAQHGESQGMGTTVVMAAIVDGKLYTAYAGDSRIYLWRAGRLQQLSVDHTWAQEAIEAGLLTREQAKQHPNRNVIKRYLGGVQEVDVDYRLVLEPGQTAGVALANQGTAVLPGDTVLLCSDGLTDMIDDAAVKDSLVRHPQLQVAVDELIQKANAAGGKDNITVVLLRKPGGAAAVAPPPPDKGAVTAAATGGGGRFRMPLVLAGLGLLGLLLVAVVGGVFALGLLNGRGEDGPTATSGPEATATPAFLEEPPAGNPATAAIMLTRLEGVQNPGSDPDLRENPELIPTLRAFLTTTPTPRPPTRTPLPSLTPSRTNTPPPGASSTPVPPPTSTPRPPTATNTPRPPTATNTPLPPTVTNTPAPTNTKVPTATNTPLPPTNTPVPTNTPLPTEPPPTNTPLPTEPPPTEPPPTEPPPTEPPPTGAPEGRGGFGPQVAAPAAGGRDIVDFLLGLGVLSSTLGAGAVLVQTGVQRRRPSRGPD